MEGEVEAMTTTGCRLPPTGYTQTPLRQSYSPGALERFEFAGAIDADGHIVEPPDLWSRYLEPRYRHRALTIRKGDGGAEYMEIDGRPSKLIRNGTPQALAAMDRLGGIVYEREPTGLLYVDNAPLGAMDAAERLQRLDLENIERCFLYPTLGVLWVAECDDEDLTQAYLRAYNRWIVDFCADSGGRLIPIAQLSLGDPVAAEAEIRRAAKDGVKGVWVPPFTWTRKPLGHPDHHRVFAAAQELGLPFGIHPSFEPKWAAPGRFGEMTSIRYTFFINVTAPDAVRHAFTSLFQFGIFEQFPELRVVILESGASWIGYWLDRMDSVFEMPQGKTIPLKNPPSSYFKRQCWISADPDETTLAAIMPLVGEDRFFWASDFPHPDHAPKYAGHMNRIAAQLGPEARAGLLGRNVSQAYGLDPM
jgi:predicted TIM-barrel fold metal-dependent hydrolase